MSEGFCKTHGHYANASAGCDYCIGEAMEKSRPTDRVAELEAERDRWYGAAQERQIEINRLRKMVEKAACGPRLDPSKCSGCNGTGLGNCICGGKGTVEAERSGYKVAALERILRAGCDKGGGG